MQQLAKQIVHHSAFDKIINVLILVNGIILGLETNPVVVEGYGDYLHLGMSLILALFIVEAMLKIIAVYPKVGLYFKDGWNLFDFLIITVSLIPATGEYAMIGRLVRVFRLLRVVSVVPELRVMVMALIQSIPSMFNVMLLTSVMFYIYAIAGYHLFHELDPVHWGSLGLSLLTLFKVLTLEGWTDIMDISMQTYGVSWIYYISFVIICGFLIVNLFIAVVLSNVEEAKNEAKATLSMTQQEIMQILRAIQKRLDVGKS